MKTSQEGGSGRKGRRAVQDGAGVPKLTGADIELGNFIQGGHHAGTTYAEASRAILREIQGIERVSEFSTQCDCERCRALREQKASTGAVYGGKEGSNLTYSYSTGAQDWGRKYLPANGGCIYIDLDHLEMCLPEVLTAYDHVAAFRAMLRIVTDGLDRANRRLPGGQRIVVLVNNSDGQGHSYGSHLDVLVSRRSYDHIFNRKLHHQLFLASLFASSIAITGSGKVGSENGQPAVAFQISSRADHLERLCAVQTTFNRPLINSRDESLCGNPSLASDPGHPGLHLARLHIICYDNTLMQTATLLKVGITQIFLSMLEQQQQQGPELILDDPVEAVQVWSRDPSLKAKARLASGKQYSAVDMQEAILEHAAKFVGEGWADSTVPRAREILDLWTETVGLLRRGDFDALSRRLDWVLKWRILQAVVEEKGLEWESPVVKHLDQVYSSLDPDEGLFWAYERSGMCDKVVTDGEIERFINEPPDDTRAWLRAQLLRRAEPSTIVDVDWDAIRFKFREQAGDRWPFYSYATMEMPDPCGFTRALFQARLDQARSVETLVRSLEHGGGVPHHHEDSAQEEGGAGAVATVRRPAPPARLGNKPQGGASPEEKQTVGEGGSDGSR